MKQTVEEKVRAAAIAKNNTIFNLKQYERDKTLAAKHKSVCSQVVEFADAHPDMPFYAVLTAMVSSCAWKNSEFEKGYKKANVDRATTIYNMAFAFNKYNGIKHKPNDVTWRLVRRFYEKVSNNYDDFIAILSKSNKIDDKRGHFQEQCENIGIWGVNDYAKKKI